MYVAKQCHTLVLQERQLGICTAAAGSRSGAVETAAAAARGGHKLSPSAFR